MTENLPIRPRWTFSQRSPANSAKRCFPQAEASRSASPSSSAAPPANLPCGLETPTGDPAKARLSRPASAWLVWPAGIASTGLAARDLGSLDTLLQRCQQVDDLAAGVLGSGYLPDLAALQ